MAPRSDPRPPRDPDDGVSDLVDLARQGSQDAFLALVTRYKGIVCAAAFAWTGDPREAEEVAQDAFAEAWRQLDQLRDAFAFGGWVRKIARRLIVRRHRTRSRARAREARAAGVALLDPGRSLPSAPPDALESAAAPPSADPSAALQIRDFYERISLEMARLPACYRDAVGLRYFGGLAVKEIAATLGVPVGTVTMRLTRGSRMLRARLSVALKDYLES